MINREWVRALRLHQWVKNLLVFVPMLAAHRVASGATWWPVTVAFVSFSLLASSVYVANDLLDVEEDRKHPTKRTRPFASGALTARSGVIAAVVLLVIGIASASVVGFQFVLAAAGYFVLASAYSLGVRRIEIADVVVLAALYTLRIIAGAIAATVVLSFWMLGFSVFLFLSLALLKRYGELRWVEPSDARPAFGRGYRAGDEPVILALGTASGLASVLVFALYISSSDVTELYSSPRLMWLACPFLLYWISRAWLIAHRGEMHDDPVVFALRDPASWISVAAAAGVIWLAT